MCARRDNKKSPATNSVLSMVREERGFCSSVTTADGLVVGTGAQVATARERIHVTFCVHARASSLFFLATIHRGAHTRNTYYATSPPPLPVRSLIMIRNTTNIIVSKHVGLGWGLGSTGMSPLPPVPSFSNHHFARNFH